jgi:hypothetical protein
MAAPARAASSSFTVGDQAVVQVWAGKDADITIRGWNRPALQFDTDDEAVQVARRPVAFGTVGNPLGVTIPLQAVKVRDPGTGVVGDVTLPPEEFKYAPDFRAGTHDAIRIVVGDAAHITVNVPPNTAILEARIRGAGTMTIAGYHGGTLFAVQGGGRMALDDIQGAAFLQPLNGRLLVTNSSFDRLRVRSNTAQLIFREDRARQIEVSTQSGPIVWDDGAFDPGLARFDSTFGAIAVGVAGGAQLEARSDDGRVYDLWERRTPIDARGDNEVSATVGGGGPLVNAVSTHGNVFVYDGTLATRRVPPPDWRRVFQLLRSTDAVPVSGAASRARMDLSQRRSGAQHRVQRHVEIARTRPVIHHVEPQRQAAVDARGRRNGDALLL